MLVSLNLLPYVKESIHLIERWNLVAFSSPIQTCNDSGVLSAPHQSQNISTNEPVRFFVNQKYCKKQWQAHAIILLIVTVLGIYKYAYESQKLENKVINAWKVAFTILHIFFTWHYHKHTDILVNYFNELLKFELESQQYTSDIDSRFIILLIKNTLACISGNATVFGIGAAIFPFAAWSVIPYDVYHFLGLEGNTSGNTTETYNLLVNFGKRAVGFTVSYVAWSIITNAGILAVVVNTMIATFCLQSTLTVFSRKISTQNNFPDAYKMYRRIQILCIMYNEFHKHSILVGFVFVGPSTLAISLYLLISRWDILDVPAIVSFLVMIEVFTSMILLNFQYAKDVFAKSDTIKRTKCGGKVVEFMLQPGSGRLTSKYWKAMPILKVHYFGSNSFDRMTSLVLLDLSVDLTINLILLKSS